MRPAKVLNLLDIAHRAITEAAREISKDDEFRFDPDKMPEEELHEVKRRVAALEVFVQVREGAKGVQGEPDSVNTDY